MGINVSGSAPSPGFRTVELKPATADRSPAQQNLPRAEPQMQLSPIGAVHHSKPKTALADNPQATITESTTPIYTDSISDAAKNLFAIGANTSKNGDPEEATASTVADPAETNETRADESITENSVEPLDIQSVDLPSNDELPDDHGEDRHSSRYRRLDTLEAHYRSCLMMIDKLVNDLLATRHLLATHFAALPLPEKRDSSRETS